MSGHNKWSKVKNKKAATDAKKSQIFSKISKLVASESKKAGGNADSPGLRAAIEKGKSANMPSDNIERAIKKGMSGKEADLQSVLYEAYAQGGSALLIEVLSDNRNRTSAEIKHILSKNGASLASPGSATWAFEKTSSGWETKTAVPVNAEDAEKLENLMEELEDNEDVQDVHSNAEYGAEKE